MIIGIPVLLVALWLFRLAWREFGFRRSLFWASGLTAMIFPFTLVYGIILPYWFRHVPAPSTKAWIIGSLAVLIAGTIAVKSVGWLKLLRGVFVAALGGAALVIVCFLFLCVISLGSSYGTGAH